MTPHPTKPGSKETLRRVVTDLRDRGAWHRAARRGRLRVAIVTMGSSDTCREQFAPLLRHRGRIRDQLGVVFRAAWVDHESGCLPRWVADAQVVLLQVNHFIELARGSGCWRPCGARATARRSSTTTATTMPGWRGRRLPVHATSW